jgi:hypothetical protein
MAGLMDGAANMQSATSGSEPLLETASAQPDALAAGGTAAAAAVPSGAAPPATAAEEPAAADGSAAAADGGAAQPDAKAQRLVPNLVSKPARPPQVHSSSTMAIAAALLNLSSRWLNLHCMVLQTHACLANKLDTLRCHSAFV